MLGFSSLLHFLNAYVIFSIYILCASFPCGCSHLCRLRVLHLHIFRGCIVSIVGKPPFVICGDIKERALEVRALR